MADRKDPPDKVAGKNFKCHPKQNVNIAVCIVCEEVYHLSDFVRLKNTKSISDIFVICNSHRNLTSKKTNITLSDEVNMLIGEIKENAIVLAQEKLQQEVNLTLSNSKNYSHDMTTLEDDDQDIKAYVTENILLKQLNEELRQKNELLYNTIELMKNNKQSYAQNHPNKHK